MLGSVNHRTRMSDGCGCRNAGDSLRSGVGVPEPIGLEKIASAIDFVNLNHTSVAGMGLLGDGSCRLCIIVNTKPGETEDRNIRSQIVIDFNGPTAFSCLRHCRCVLAP
jgi:hypothetical protein